MKILESQGFDPTSNTVLRTVDGAGMTLPVSVTNRVDSFKNENLRKISFHLALCEPEEAEKKMKRRAERTLAKKK